MKWIGWRRRPHKAVAIRETKRAILLATTAAVAAAALNLLAAFNIYPWPATDPTRVALATGFALILVAYRSYQVALWQRWWEIFLSPETERPALCGARLSESCKCALPQGHVSRYHSCANCPARWDSDMMPQAGSLGMENPS